MSERKRSAASGGQYRIRIHPAYDAQLKRLAKRQGYSAPRLIARLVEQVCDAEPTASGIDLNHAATPLDALRGAFFEQLLEQIGSLISAAIRTEIAPLRDGAGRAESDSQRATEHTSDAIDAIRKLTAQVAEINALARKTAQDAILNQFVLVHCLLARFLEERKVTSEQAPRLHLVRQPLGHTNQVVSFVWSALLDQSAKFRDQLIAHVRDDLASAAPQELASAKTEAALFPPTDAP